MTRVDRLYETSSCQAWKAQIGDDSSREVAPSLASGMRQLFRAEEHGFSSVKRTNPTFTNLSARAYPFASSSHNRWGSVG